MYIKDNNFTLTVYYGTIHNLLSVEGGICRWGSSCSTKPLTNQFRVWGGHQFVYKIFMIFSYFNFLKGLKMKIKHCLVVLERPIKFHVWGGGDTLVAQVFLQHYQEHHFLNNLKSKSTTPDSKLWMVSKVPMELFQTF